MAILSRVGQSHYDTNFLVVRVHTVARFCMYSVGMQVQLFTAVQS